MNGTENQRHQEGKAYVPQGLYDRSIGELFRNLSRETIRLIGQELDYAKVEMSEKISRASKDSMYLIAGAAVIYAGFLFFLVALVIGLASVMPLGLSALLIGFAVMAIGSLIVRVGRKKLRQDDLVPRKTIETLKGDKEWIKSQMM